MTSVVREVESRVHVGFPGAWRWRAVFLVPNRYAVTIYTTAEANHYLFDGTTTAGFIGDRRVSAVVTPDDPVRTQARFVAVSLLDALRLPGVAVAETPSSALAPGVAAELTAVFADDGSRYRLRLDEHGLVVGVEGPVVLEPVGRGRVVATYDDFRRVGGRLFPYRTTWTLNGTLVAEDRTLRLCPDPAGLDTSAFATPARLPECAPGEPPVGG